MTYDIYGCNLRPGHCEVHPHVHEEYPCSVCVAERQLQHPPEPQYDEKAELEHYLGQARDEIERLRLVIENYRLGGRWKGSEIDALLGRNAKLQAAVDAVGAYFNVDVNDPGKVDEAHENLYEAFAALEETDDEKT